MARHPLWKRLLRISALVVGVLLVVLVAAMTFGVSVELERARGPLAHLASKALGRKVSLDGDILLTVGFVPAVEIGGVRIANPPGFSGPMFAELGRARLCAEVMPLLLGKLVVRSVEVSGVALHLEEAADGRANWTFGDPNAAKAPSPAPKPAPQANATGPTYTPKALDVREVRLTDIRLDFQSKMTGAKGDLKIDECLGRGRSGQPIQLDFKGSALGRPYTFTIRAVSLAELFDDDTAWLEFALDIAKTTFSFAGEMRLPVSRPWLDVQAGVSGGNMTDLGGLIGVDLPPFGPYDANCTLSLREKLAELRSLDVGVGSSRLNGEASFDNRGPKPVVRVALSAPAVQLEDFSLGNWTATGGADPNATQAADTVPSPGNATANATKPLLSKEFLDSFDASLEVNVDQVSWGKEKLGRGSLNATVADGRASVDPIHLEIPGGSMDLRASMTPGDRGFKAEAQAHVHRFDFGILARHAKPGTDMGGLFSLDMDIATRAERLQGMMRHANGNLTVWAQPVNFKAGIMDLWAVNLFSAVMPKLEGDNPSMINCLVADFTIKDGVMRPEKLVVDTSQIRIQGRGSVDFKQRRLDLNLAPSAKHPQFFSLATPVEIHGSMDSFGIGVSVVDILGTVVNFVASPVVVPFRRMIETDLPRDGHDMCGAGGE